MVMELASLPPELFGYIVAHLPQVDALGLSSTSKTYRALLAPFVFKSIAFTNAESSAASALAAAKTYGEYVTKLQFTCHVRDSPVTKKKEEEKSPYPQYSDTRTDDSPVLSKAVVALLSGVDLPNFHPDEVEMHFAYDFKMDIWDELREIETAADVLQAESKSVWRVLMAEAWDALARSGNRVRRLSILDFLSFGVSVFETERWARFLAGLTHLRLEFAGTDWDYTVNGCEGFRDFVAHLEGWIFAHTTSLESLELCGPDEVPIGSRHAWNNNPLPLNPSHMPKLLHLELKECVISPELLEFIRGHVKSLKTLKLTECYAENYDVKGDELWWHEFFDRLCDMEGGLQQLSTSNSKVPLSHDEREIGRLVESDTGRKLFPYIGIDEKYGMALNDEDTNVKEFRSGKYQKAFDRLQDAITVNARSE